jgi:hypothetical protein
MADRAWKAFERRVARLFGGRRRGPDTRDVDAGKSDVCGVPGFAIECALGRKYTGYTAMLEKARQAERNARDHELPVAVLKAPRIADTDALVVMRLPTFLAWFGPSAQEAEQ